MGEEAAGRRRPTVEPLGPRHDRTAFSCGVASLDRYLQTQASQDARRHLSAPFVLVFENDVVGGFYTLAATAIVAPDLPPAIIGKLPRYPLIPATLLGRLAVDVRFHGRGWGRHLLADALVRAYRSEVASFAMVVDAIDDEAVRFYEREGFIPFPDRPRGLFLPMATIAGLVA